MQELVYRCRHGRRFPLHDRSEGREVASFLSGPLCLVMRHLRVVSHTGENDLPGPPHFSRLPNGWLFAGRSGIARPVNDMTRILEAAQQGDPRAAAELLPLVYDELRRIAAHKMAQESPGQTLQPTALVHEVWLRLAGEDGPKFQSRAHFFAAAAEAMRRILIESARRKRSLKRGGAPLREELLDSHLIQNVPPDELLAVDEALGLLVAEDPVAADLVKLRYFVGLTMDEAAAALGLPLRSAERLWTYARAWLRRSIGGPSA
jgi:RNA polymerase sigma factor (TIGR02999 family)